MAERGVWIPVRASAKGFIGDIIKAASGAGKQGAATLGQEMERGARTAGQRAGKAAADGMASQKAAIERVSQQLAAARDAEANAAGAVRVAEEKLKETRASAAEDSSKVARAEEQLAEAQRKQETAAGQAARASADLDKARSGAAGTARTVMRAEDALQKSKDAAAKSNGDLRVAEKQLEEIRAQSDASASKIAQAEEKVEAARRKTASAADEVRTKEGLLGAARADAEAGSRKAGEAADETGKAMRRGADNANEYGNSMMSAGKQAANFAIKAGGILGLTAGFSQVVSVGNELTNNLNTMRAVGNATDAQLAAVSQRARELGNDIDLPATSAVDATAAMVELAKGGFKVEQAMAGAKGTLQLAAAAQIGAVEAATVQSQMLQAFGKDAGYASNAADILANAANESSAEIMDIAGGMQQFGAVAHLFKVPMEDASAALAMLSNAGISGSDAGTLMKSALLKLANPSKQAGQAMDELGLNAYDAQGKFVGLASIFEQLQTASKKMTDQQYQQRTALVFGSDAMRLSGIAAANGAKGFDTMRDKMLKQGSASKTAASQTEGLPGAFERAKNSLEELMLVIYDLIKGPLGVGLDVIAKGFSLLATAVGNAGGFLSRNKVVIAAITAAIVAAYGPTIGWFLAFKAAAIYLKAYALATKIAAAATRLFNASLLANPIGLIVAAVIALGVALWAFFTKTETGRKLWAVIWGAIKSSISAVWNWIKNTLWPGIQSVFKGIGTVVMWLWNNVIKPAWWGIQTTFTTVWKVIQTIFQGWMTIFRNVGKVAGEVKDFIVGGWTTLINFFTGIPGKIKNLAGGMWDGIKSSFKTLINFLIRGWNFFAKKLSFTVPDIPGVPRRGEKVQPIPTIPEFRTGGYTGRKGRDVVAGVVHGDEHVIRSEARRQLEANHPGALDYMNATGQIPGYRTGGYVSPAGLDGKGKVRLGNISGQGITTDIQQSMWDALRAAFPDAELFSATRTVQTEGHADHHNGGKAIDISPSSAINSWIASKFPNSLELFFDPGKNLKNGQPTGPIGGHGDHNHWAMDRVISPTSGAAASGADDPSSADGAFAAPGANSDGRKSKEQLKAEYDAELLALKKQYGIGATDDEVRQKRADVTRRRNDLNQQYRADKAAAAGDKDRLKALADTYRTEKDKLTKESEDLTELSQNKGLAKSADRAAYQAAKAKLDDKYKQLRADLKEQDEGGDGTGRSDDGKPKSWSQIAGMAVTEQLDDVADFFGIKDTWMWDPSKLHADTGSKNDLRRPSSADRSGAHPGDTITPPASTGSGDPKNYPFQISKAAKDMGLAERAAIIGTATGLVESSDPMKMYANKAVPESLQFPHDAVGADHDSVGIFQQRPSWGTVAQRMNAYESAKMFFGALQKIDGWESMDMGAAAQAVQRSAYPDRYGQKMDRARQLVKSVGVYDRGGVLPHGGVAINLSGEDEYVLNPHDAKPIISPTSSNLSVQEPAGSEGYGRRGGAPFIGNVTLQAVDIDEGIRKFTRETKRLSEADYLAGGR